MDLSRHDDDGASAALLRQQPPGAGPAVFGITTTSATYLSSVRLAQALKTAHGPDAVVIFGGHHASADPQTILEHHPEVDVIIAGEGEAAIAHFLASWPDVTRTPNLWRRDPVRGIVSNPPAPLLTAGVLDTLRLGPGWFLEGRDVGKFHRYTYVSARGCPLKCRFCSVADQPIRGKTADVVAAEIRDLVEADFRRITIEDNFFAHSPARTREICNALRGLRAEGLSFDWDCQSRVEAVARPGVAADLATAGCSAVYLGVEALTSAELDFLGKAPNAERYLKLLAGTAIPELIANGIDPYVNLQFGLPPEAGSQPGETLAQLGRLGRIAVELGSTITIFPQLYVLYPGTAHFREFSEAGVISPSIFEDFSRWEYSDPQLVDWMGRHFAHGVGGIPLGILDREALAHHDFRVDWAAALRISGLLRQAEVTPGISVFRFDDHLVEVGSST